MPVRLARVFCSGGLGPSILLQPLALTAAFEAHLRLKFVDAAPS
jgi:hypothetical protein